MNSLKLLKTLTILSLGLMVCFSCQQQGKKSPLFIAVSKERPAAN